MESPKLSAEEIAKAAAHGVAIALAARQPQGPRRVEDLKIFVSKQPKEMYEVALREEKGQVRVLEMKLVAGQ